MIGNAAALVAAAAVAVTGSPWSDIVIGLLVAAGVRPLGGAGRARCLARGGHAELSRARRQKLPNF